MTLVNADTGEIVADITADEARQITDQIKVAVEGAWHLIKRAYETRAWAALGYSSWDDYCTREFGTSRLKLPREDRQEIVASLRDSGLSLRAIEAATGVSRPTIIKDLRDEVVNSSPPDDLDGPLPFIADDEPELKQKITGTDGKRYSPPIPKPKPKRGSLNDAAQKAGWEFRKATERLERIVADDRFVGNRQQVASHLRGHLTYAVEAVQGLLDALDNEPQEAR